MAQVNETPILPAATTGAGTSSRAVFFCAPHRVMFFAGTVQLVVALLYWGVELTGRHTALWPPLATTVPITWAHNFLMLYGLYTFFIFGFLMTTFPKWMRTVAVPRGAYIAAFSLLSAGMLVYYAGLFASQRVLETGILLFLCGWLIALAALGNIYLHPGRPPTVYESVLSIALIGGFLGAVSGLLWLWTRGEWWYRIMITAGIWLYLVPVMVTVSHRMIPFFSGAALENYETRNPAWTLPAIGACIAGHAGLELAQLPEWLFAVDLPLAGMALWLSLQWQLKRSFRVPLLAMLHVAFLWFGLGMLLYGLQSLAFLLQDQFLLGKAPLHALGIGFITSMVLAMVSRVTMGHSGRPLVATRLTLACFIMLQFVALLRLSGEIPGSVLRSASYANPAAALLWLIIVTAWAWHYLPIYLKSRVDGKPG